MDPGARRVSQPPDFLVKLLAMVQEEAPHVITWSGGKVFIQDPLLLEKQLSAYFRHSNFSSFQRQLNNFGFRKVEGKGRFAPCMYMHDQLQGLPPSALLRIRRKTTPSAAPQTTGDAAPARPALAPKADGDAAARAAGEPNKRQRSAAARYDAPAAAAPVPPPAPVAVAAPPPARPVASPPQDRAAFSAPAGIAGAASSLPAPEIPYCAVVRNPPTFYGIGVKRSPSAAALAMPAYDSPVAAVTRQAAAEAPRQTFPAAAFPAAFPPADLAAAAPPLRPIVSYDPLDVFDAALSGDRAAMVATTRALPPLPLRPEARPAVAEAVAPALRVNIFGKCHKFVVADFHGDQPTITQQGAADGKPFEEDQSENDSDDWHEEEA
ncbi:hypothetical protein M885DRAFT_60051 [Pelagophyceae sp. CCMP2097]|nr:hypothetical protein M885DRAFT_60051 [Pelagophyceae sp. CCMP2097]